MKDFIICNAVPAYSEAPVAAMLLKTKGEALLSAIRDKQSAQNYLVIDKNAPETKTLLEMKETKFSDLNLEIVQVEEGSGFVYANDSALLQVIAGEKPLPSNAVKHEGIYNIETLLDAKEKTVYILGNGIKEGQYRFETTVRPESILKECGFKGEFKAMYLGYPMGAFITSEALEQEMCLTTDLIRIYDASDCMLSALLQIAQSYQKETCGRCVFGYEGVFQINTILADMVQKKGKSDDFALLQDLCAMMRQQTLCEIDAKLADTVLDALSQFKQEIEEHVTKKTCKAAACSKFVTYHILQDKCTGCTDCVDACEDDAIAGKKRFIHVIDQDECTQCGACVAACDEGAIIKAGAIKPKCPTKPIPCKA